MVVVVEFQTTRMRLRKDGCFTAEAHEGHDYCKIHIILRVSIPRLSIPDILHHPTIRVCCCLKLQHITIIIMTSGAREARTHAKQQTIKNQNQGSASCLSEPASQPSQVPNIVPIVCTCLQHTTTDYLAFWYTVSHATTTTYKRKPHCATAARRTTFFVMISCLASHLRPSLSQRLRIPWGKRLDSRSRVSGPERLR